MGESRRRGVVMGEARGVGRGPGGRRPAGTTSGRGVRASICAIAALAGLAPGLDRGARAQQPEAPQPGAPQPEAPQPGAPQPGAAADGAVQDLSLRYRFVERYGLAESLERPDQLVQYQVGAFETIKGEIEQARGAPVRQEITYQTVYTERPAKLGRFGEVTDTVRRYDVFRAIGPAQIDPRATALLKGLVLWFHPRPIGAPEMISLTPNRSIRQREYETILGQIFTPRLGAVLPPRPVLMADKWSIPRQAARVILGSVPDAGEYRLEGTLTRVEKATAGTAMTAIVDIEGVLDFEQGAGAVRARLWFVFEPVRAGAAATPKEAPGPSAKGTAPRAAGIVEARGHVAKLVMSLRKTSPVDQNGRLQQIQTGELHLERRPAPAQAEPLAVPKEPPPPDETNSWLVFDDPQGRFHLRHRQDLAVEVNVPDILVLHADSPQGRAETLMISDLPRDPDPARDRQWSDPQAFVRYVRETQERRGFEVINGPMGWLPEADWAPMKRKVYRCELALRQKDGSRMFFDAYLVLFSRGDHFYIQALTNRDDHLAFREQAEKLIRTLDLDPSAPGMADAAARRPALTPPAATAPSRDVPAAPPVPRLDRRP